MYYKNTSGGNGDSVCAEQAMDLDPGDHNSHPIWNLKLIYTVLNVQYVVLSNAIM